MGKIEGGLLEHIRREILPQYAGFDEAHGPDHVRRVIENSLELAEGLEVDMDMVYTIAAYHDVGIQYGRKDHGVTSGRYLMEDRALERWFTPEQRQTMRDAVEDHRASKEGEPRTLYGRIISEADRDIDPEVVVRRCAEYGKAHEPHLGREEQIRRIEKHVREKYGGNGYLRLWLPCPRNEQGLATLRDWLRTGKLREVCEKYV